jgi:hypothetical protein
MLFETLEETQMLMSERRVCTRDSRPPTDSTVGPTYSEGDEVSDPVGRAEAPKYCRSIAPKAWPITTQRKRNILNYKGVTILSQVGQFGRSKAGQANKSQSS